MSIPEISNIRNRVLVPHKILSPLQSDIQHAIQPFRLAHISLRRIRNPLFRQTIKVISLSLHGAQTTMLPGDPLLHQRQLRVIFEGEFKLGIKVSCQIGQNGSTFHDAQTVLVVVDEDGDAAVGAFVGEPLLFLDVLHNVDALEDVVGFAVGCFEFFEEDACFVACGARLGMMNDFSWHCVSVDCEGSSPLGVPNVSSSRPLLAISPLGRSDMAWRFCRGMVVVEKEDDENVVSAGEVFLIRWCVVCCRRSRGVRIMKARRKMKRRERRR